MFTNMGLHVIKNPAGTFSFVGSIPLELGKRVKPTSSDIMAGRFFMDGETAYAVKFPVFKTKEDAINHAKKSGFTVL